MIRKLQAKPFKTLAESIAAFPSPPHSPLPSSAAISTQLVPGSVNAAPRPTNSIDCLILQSRFECLKNEVMSYSGASQSCKKDTTSGSAGVCNLPRLLRMRSRGPPRRQCRQLPCWSGLHRSPPHQLAIALRRPQRNVGTMASATNDCIRTVNPRYGPHQLLQQEARLERRVPTLRGPGQHWQLSRYADG